MFDWANSAVSAIVMTFVFSVYFARAVYGDEVAGSAAWGFAQGCAGVAVAILSPLVGAWVDKWGPRLPALRAITVAAIAMTGSLFMVQPDPAFVPLALVLAGLLTVTFEVMQNLYGSLLPVVAPPDMRGRISGIGWGAGYFGSIVCLLVVLLGFIGLGGKPGLLGLPTDNAFPLRSAMVFTALWFFVFALPLLFSRTDAPRTGLDARASLRAGLQSLRGLITTLRAHPNTALFLGASALYRDGLVTLFAVGGLYAAGTFGMSFAEIIMFAVALNIASGIGALVFAGLDDRLGSKPTIQMALVGLIGMGLVLVSVTDKTMFMAAACILGLFIGPAQAASRTLLVRMAPPEKMGEFFGLYALTGKSIAFMGPFAFAAVTAATGSQRLGVATILVFWALGLALLHKVKVPS